MISKLGAYVTLASTKLVVPTHNATDSGDDSISRGINKFLFSGENSVYKIAKRCILPVAIAACIYGVFAWITSPTGKGAEQGKKVFLTAILAIAALYLIPTVLEQVVSMAGEF